jgi:hypothetical protein
VLRSTAALAAQGRCLLPEEALAEAGLTPHAIIAAPAQAAPVVAALARAGLPPSPALAGLPRAAVAAALPLVLARRDLARLARGAAVPAQRGPGGSAGGDLGGCHRPAMIATPSPCRPLATMAWERDAGQRGRGASRPQGLLLPEVAMSTRVLPVLAALGLALPFRLRRLRQASGGGRYGGGYSAPRYASYGGGYGDPLGRWRLWRHRWHHHHGGWH